MSLLLSRYGILLLPELQASEDSHRTFILPTWSSISVLSIRFRYYMSTHEGPVVTRVGNFVQGFCGSGVGSSSNEKSRSLFWVHLYCGDDGEQIKGAALQRGWSRNRLGVVGRQQ